MAFPPLKVVALAVSITEQFGKFLLISRSSAAIAVGDPLGGLAWGPLTLVNPSSLSFPWLQPSVAAAISVSQVSEYISVSFVLLRSSAQEKNSRGVARLP